MSRIANVRRALGAVLVTLCISLGSTASAQSPIGTGNLVAVRIGDGVAALSGSSQATFLDEFTTAGTAVQSVAMPTAVSGTNYRLTNSGTATSEGNLNLSTDGRYLILCGYDAAPGTTGIAATTTSGATAVLRVIGRVDRNLGIDTTTGLTAYSATNIRSATSVTGNDFWVGGPTNGVSYVPSVGATTSTQLVTNPNNIRVVRIFGGQLFTGSATGAYQGVSAVGVGTPTTSGQTLSLLPGFPTATGPSAYDFFFADANTLYVADDRTNGSGGIQKWVLTAGTWTLQYTLAIAPTVGCRGLTGVVSLGTTTLYATTTESSANRIVTVTDAGAGSPFTVLATAAVNTVYRGLRFMTPLASVSVVGTGCPGTGSLVPTLSTSQLPFLGNLGFSVDVAQGASGSAAFLYVSLGTDPNGVAVGGGCTVYLDFPSLLILLQANITPTGPVPTGIAGDAVIPFPIPDLAQLAGLHVGFQSAIVDAGSPLGLTLTNALDCVLN